MGRIGDGRAVSLVLGAVIVAVAASVLFGEDGLTHLHRLEAERQRLGEAAVALLQENAAKREEIARLNGDDFYLETLARRELGLVRPDELIYRFRRPPSR